jgi:hypothetical protein
LTAFSTARDLKLSLIIKSTEPYAAFSPPVHIPTATGFSNKPGCRESYTAVATVKLSKFNVNNGKYDIDEVIEFRLAALEFGGSFQGKYISSDK